MNQKQVFRVHTRRFGEVEVRADTVLTFPQGLVGLPELTRFALLAGAAPLRWMQSLDDPDTALVVIDAEQVIADYEIGPAADDLTLVLDEDGVAVLSVLLVVTVPRERPEQATVNLMAPLVVNPDRRVGVQAMLADHYPLRHPLAAGVTEALGAVSTR